MDCQTLLDLGDPTDGSLDELAERYLAARALANEFTAIGDAIELELAARMETDEVPVRGVGVLVRGAEKRSAWRDKHASAEFRYQTGLAVVREIALDIATGELEPVKRNVAQATVDLMLDVIPAFSSVKARGRALGIHPDEYRTVSEVYRVTVDTAQQEDIQP